MNTLRAARSDETDVLRDLAMRSKAHWGYDSAFMAACIAPFTFTAEELANEEFGVVDGAEGPVAFAKLRLVGDTAHLDKAFVDPDAMGQGLGRALVTWAISRACAAGASCIMIESDPFAEAFYQKLGARTVGRIASEAIPGRTLPLMRLDLSPRLGAT